LKTNNLTSLFCAYLDNILSDLFKDYATAIVNVSKAEEFQGSISELIAVAQNLVYYSVYYSLLFLTHSSFVESQRQLLEKIRIKQQNMTLWTQYTPMNFQHKYLLRSINDKNHCSFLFLL
jgi:hypothetical protein